MSPSLQGGPPLSASGTGVGSGVGAGPAPRGPVPPVALNGDSDGCWVPPELRRCSAMQWMEFKAVVELPLRRRSDVIDSGASSPATVPSPEGHFGYVFSSTACNQYLVTGAGDGMLKVRGKMGRVCLA